MTPDIRSRLELAYEALKELEMAPLVPVDRVALAFAQVGLEDLIACSADEVTEEP